MGDLLCYRFWAQNLCTPVKQTSGTPVVVQTPDAPVYSLPVSHTSKHTDNYAEGNGDPLLRHHNKQTLFRDGWKDLSKSSQVLRIVPVVLMSIYSLKLSSASVMKVRYEIELAEIWLQSAHSLCYCFQNPHL